MIWNCSGAISEHVAADGDEARAGDGNTLGLTETAKVEGSKREQHRPDLFAQ